jgi:antitoxin FitA
MEVPLTEEIRTELPLSAWEFIRSLFEKHGAIGDEFGAIMDDIEAERKTDFGRPLADCPLDSCKGSG